MDLSAIILKVGTEMETITLHGVRGWNGWRYFISTMDETASLLPREFDEHEYQQQSEIVDSWEAALRLLDRYPWFRLTPLAVHLRFRERIWAAVQSRLQRDGAEPPFPKQVERWRDICAESPTLEAALKTIRSQMAAHAEERITDWDLVIDRAMGALLGLAVGDALGTTLEFADRDTCPHHSEMTGGGPFRLEPGEWTDDTAMALALADSLLARRKLDPLDLMTRFVTWWKEGEYSCTGRCFDIGITTRHALAQFCRTGDPYAGATDENTGGNGSLMRLAPVVLFNLDDKDLAVEMTRSQSLTTHGAPQAVEACAYFAEILWEAIKGRQQDGPRAAHMEWPSSHSFHCRWGVARQDT